ncbi:MAG: ATP-binding protein [Roseiflexus sp.]|nr:ATP-binding protein [Roseiflexus sp.]MCS7289438.1 ATP-binding protein [Roseiflexus sp.]MDW8233651.1 ATP-binding protein [Roseiflexaceae bacterium]
MLLIEAYVATQTLNEGLDAIHDMIERFWKDVASFHQLPSESWRHLFTTALAEVAANGLRHAYPPDATERPLWVRLRLFPDRVEALVIDQGAPYEPISFAPDAPGNETDIAKLPESGYGLFIARSALDSLHYRRTRSGYNCWRLVKKK